MVFLYPLGTPLFYLFLLRRNRPRLDRLRVNQALRVQLINKARASSDYQSGRASRDERQVPWLISEEERSRLSDDMLKELRELEHEDASERAALPSYISKLLKGYELRVPWFEVFECVRKLAIACLPVFFQPSGSASQLLFGLMICFMCFGFYVAFDPFEDRGNDAVAQLCQLQIFFSLLSSVALTYEDDENAGSNIDVLLVVLWFLPLTVAFYLESPLTSVVSSLLSMLKEKLDAKAGRGNDEEGVQVAITNEPPSTSGHGNTKAEGQVAAPSQHAVARQEQSTQKWLQEQNRSDPNQESTRLSDMLGTGEFPDEPSVERRPSLGLQQLVSSPRLGEGSV